MKRNKLLLSIVLCLFSAVGCWAKNSVAPMSVGNVFMKLDDTEATVPVKLTNFGNTEVNSISYTLYHLDTNQSEGPFTLNFDTPLADGETRQVEIPMKPGITFGKADVLFSVTLVNGEYNEASVSYTYITCCTVNKIPHKRVLIEDFTALWCQYCPTGMVAMEVLVREHPEDVVPVSIHKADKISKQVSPDAYQDGTISTYAVTLPSVWCARDSKIAGYDGESIYQIEKDRLTYMNIDVKAQWDETGNNINVTTEVEPCMTPEEGSTYAVGYVLTASGLKNDSWYQQANYSYYMSDSFKDAPSEMDFFRDPANYVEDYYYVKGITFNHVAIESQGIRNGLENSLTGDFEANKTKTHTTTFSNIGKYGIIQDRSQIRVVAVLFNTKTNKVENAAVCKITTPSETFSMSFDQCDWATLYTDRSYTVPRGIETYCIDAEGKVEQLSDGTTAVSIAANTPLLLKGKQGDVCTFEYTDASGSVVETALRGSTADGLTTTGSATLGDSDVYYYRLTCDEAHPDAGFYWAADGGGAFTNEAGRCYLVLPRANVPENRKEGFVLGEDDKEVETGIKHAESTRPAKGTTVFDITGRKVKTVTVPGLYIVNGKKTVLK